MTVRPAVVLARLAHLAQVLTALRRLRAIQIAVRLAGLAGLRNLLVHDCGDVDPTRLWALVDARVPDLEDAHRALASIPELASSAP